jgi:hypothetical protein
MKSFCSGSSPAGWPHAAKCMTGTLESEILYLRIRMTQPESVMEMSSATGLVILQALEDNDQGKLTSFDVFETPWPQELPEKARARWKLILGDMMKVLPGWLSQNQVDYLHVDTCHEAPCIAWYVKEVLPKVKGRGRVYASLHDLYTCFTGTPPGPMSMEGMMVFEGLLYQARSTHAHTFCFGRSEKIDQLATKRAEKFGTEEAAIVIGMCKSCGWNGRDYASTLYVDMLD